MPKLYDKVSIPISQLFCLNTFTWKVCSYCTNRVTRLFHQPYSSSRRWEKEIQTNIWDNHDLQVTILITPAFTLMMLLHHRQLIQLFLNSISYHEFHSNREFLSLYPPNHEEKDNLTSHCKKSQYVYDLFVVQDYIPSHKSILLEEYHSIYIYTIKFIATSSLRSS